MKARQRKKLIKKSMFVVDVASIPEGLALDEWYELLDKFGIIVYDSRYKADKVEVHPKRNTRLFRYVEVKSLNK
jgi:hypothetical protein